MVVNAVVTTDIFDKELKAAREIRWDKTYGALAQTQEESDVVLVNRKATIVIELVIQVSDVSHTMQHWHVYQKWNKRLFNEMHAAYAAGRLDKDPIEGWYGGELWFFDNYIIPLASKMKDCKVFGVSCDEFLDFATDNRVEWASKGKAIVAEWAGEIRREEPLPIVFDDGGNDGDDSDDGDDGDCDQSKAAEDSQYVSIVSC